MCRSCDSAIRLLLAKVISGSNDEPVNPVGQNQTTDDFDDDLPKRIFPSCLELFKCLRSLQIQVETIRSPQMARDTVKLSKNAVSNYVTSLEKHRIPLSVKNLGVPKEIRYVLTRILRLPELGDSGYYKDVG